MSVGSQELDRSALERKEREELATIATALGKKPPSRARKAEIVDLILQLAGVDGAAPAADAAPEKPKRTRRTRSSAKADEPKGDDAKAANGKGESAKTESAKAANGKAETPKAETPKAENAKADQPTAEPPNTEGDAKADEPKADEPKAPAEADESKAEANGGVKVEGAAAEEDRPAGRSDRQPSQASQPSLPMGRGGGEQRNGQPRGQQNQGNQGNQGNRQGQNHQGQGQGHQGQGNKQFRVDVEPEPGNRRRRRRGRGGDRDRGPQEEVFSGEPVDVEGTLDLRDEGYGFLRLKGYLPSKDDVYVSVKQVRQFGLRKGDIVTGASRPAGRNEKNPALLRIDKVNAKDPETARRRPRFEDLTPLFPDQRLRMEMVDDPTNMTARIIDLISPIGKGQRGLIVSPPKAGKTTVMKQIARSIETNNPEVKLIVTLIDERPEEVTDFRRWLIRGDVVASTFDRPSDEHTAVAELVIERAKRLVEEGQDVCIILDGITRIARAYNLAAPATGRIMSGGIDTGALYPPKRFFGAARNAEEGGSLTILATALVETGSKMDEVIFEEFKATGNMELKLDRKLAERRIYPAIDVDASSTRHEELLFERRQLQQAWRLRRVLSGLAGEGGTAAAGLEMLIDRLKTFKTNDEFLAEVAKAPGAV